LAASTSALQSAPHGAPLLQPFPPPNPPPSLAQPMLHSGPITRDGVHEALQRLFKVMLWGWN
jgi:mRNA-decapping enzyme 1B